MKNILSLMVSQKRNRPKAKKTRPSEQLRTGTELEFTPYINFGIAHDKQHQNKCTRTLIMSTEDKKVNKRYWYDDRDYISWKLIHEKREYLTIEQNRKLVNNTLKLLISQKKVDDFKKSVMTIKEFSDQYMVHLEIIYMRINLTGC